MNHFSLIIFYHSVWLGFEPFGYQSRCIVSWCSLRSRAKDITITICHNKPPDRNWGWSVNDVMPIRNGPEDLRILKRGSWILTVGFFGSLPTEILNITRRAARWGRISIVWLAKTFKNCVSLVSPWIGARN